MRLDKYSNEGYGARAFNLCPNVILNENVFGNHSDPLHQRQTQKHELLSQAVHTLRVELLRPVLREAASSLRRPEQAHS